MQAIPVCIYFCNLKSLTWKRKSILKKKKNEKKGGGGRRNQTLGVKCLWLCLVNIHPLYLLSTTSIITTNLKPLNHQLYLINVTNSYSVVTWYSASRLFKIKPFKHSYPLHIAGEENISLLPSQSLFFFFFFFPFLFAQHFHVFRHFMHIHEV